MFSNQNQQKISNKFFCIYCDYTTSRKCNYSDHILSRKHQKSIISNQNQQNQQKISEISEIKFSCQNCGKIYKDNSGLWRHKKKCIVNNYNEIESDEKIKQSILSDKDLIMMLVKQNSQLMDLVKKRN